VLAARVWGRARICSSVQCVAVAARAVVLRESWMDGGGPEAESRGDEHSVGPGGNVKLGSWNKAVSESKAGKNNHSPRKRAKGHRTSVSGSCAPLRLRAAEQGFSISALLAEAIKLRERWSRGSSTTAIGPQGPAARGDWPPRIFGAALWFHPPATCRPPIPLRLTTTTSEEFVET
jgi:hypothetical protein